MVPRMMRSKSIILSREELMSNIRKQITSPKQKALLAIPLVLALVSSAPLAMAADSAGQAAAAAFPIYAGGKQLTSDQDPVLLDGSMYLPLRAFGEALGKQIEWNDWDRKIVIKDAPTVKEVYEWKNPKELGRGISEGGFSGLTHLPGDPDNVFYTLSDRGPNGQIGKNKLRTFPIEHFTPRIYKIKTENGSIEVLETIELKLPEGKAGTVSKSRLLTGLSNAEGADEVPYDEKGATTLSYDPDGLDLEGIAYSPADDTFWLCDEYRPSIIQIKRDGTVLGRYVPKGAKQLLQGSQLNVVELFPEVYNKRISNRGFEGITISPDGKYLYTSIQSPLANPDTKTGESSRNMRILKLDLATKQLAGEYVYVAENAQQFGSVKQKDVVISDLYAMADDVLLIDERDKNAGKDAELKRLYKADFSQAANLLGTEWSEKLEQLTVEQLRSGGIVPVAKELAVDIAKLGYPWEKIEGIAVLDKRTIAIVNDNDFAVDYDENANLKLTGVPTQMHVVEVKEDLY